MNVIKQDDKPMIETLRSSVYPGANDDSIRMVLAYCMASKLDPLQKPVHIVPMWDRVRSEMRDVIMPGIGLYRTQAARTGQCAGITEPEFGDSITEKIGGEEITYPEWCKVTVKRVIGGVIAEFTAREFWKENYAVKGGKEKSIAPNAMWSKRPRGQIAKCAEAQALRKAFPELGSAPTAEEMEGKQIDAHSAESLVSDGAVNLLSATGASTKARIDAIAADNSLADKFSAIVKKTTEIAQNDIDKAAAYLYEDSGADNDDIMAMWSMLPGDVRRGINNARRGGHAVTQ